MSKTTKIVNPTSGPKKIKLEDRRSTIRKLWLGTTMTSALALLPSSWVKPVVDSVVLPAHAESSPTDCYSIEVRVFDLSDAGQSGGIGSFQIEIFTTAPDILNQVHVSASVDNGTLTEASPEADIYAGNSLIFGWFGPAIPGTAIPINATELTVLWTCANGDTGSDSFDLVDLVTLASV